MIPYAPYTINVSRIILLVPFIQTVKLNVKVNSLCLSLNIDSAPYRRLKIMGSAIFVHHTFMVTDFGFTSEM